VHLPAFSSSVIAHQLLMKVYCFLFKHNGKKYADYWCSRGSQAVCKFQILKKRRLHLERHYGKTQLVFFFKHEPAPLD
jgi:hypothetical protein